MPETKFIETEALLRAMQDAEADSGNTETTLTYLRDNFLPNELRNLGEAIGILDECITQVRREKAQAPDAPIGSRWYWAHKHWVVTAECEVDGEPGVVLSLDPEAVQRVGKRKSAPPLATRLLVRQGISK